MKLFLVVFAVLATAVYDSVAFDRTMSYPSALGDERTTTHRPAPVKDGLTSTHPPAPLGDDRSTTYRPTTLGDERSTTLRPAPLDDRTTTHRPAPIKDGRTTTYRPAPLGDGRPTTLRPAPLQDDRLKLTPRPAPLDDYVGEIQETEGGPIVFLGKEAIEAVYGPPSCKLGPKIGNPICFMKCVTRSHKGGYCKGKVCTCVD